MAGQTRINGNLIDTGTDPEDIVSISAGDARYPKLDGPNTLSGDLTVDNGTLFVDSANGRVGVGTNNPSFNFDVRGTSDVTIRAQNTTDGVATLNLRNVGTDDLFLTQEGGATKFFHSSNERMRIDNNGDISFYEDTGTTPKFFWDASAERLGIGTSSPQTDLHISSPSPILRIDSESNSSDPQIQFEVLGGTKGGIGIDNSISGDPLVISRTGIGTDNTIVITDDNRVGIGKTNPGRSLDVSGTTVSDRFVSKILTFLGQSQQDVYQDIIDLEQADFRNTLTHVISYVNGTHGFVSGTVSVAWNGGVYKTKVTQIHSFDNSAELRIDNNVLQFRQTTWDNLTVKVRMHIIG